MYAQGDEELSHSQSKIQHRAKST